MTKSEQVREIVAKIKQLKEELDKNSNDQESKRKISVYEFQLRQALIS